MASIPSFARHPKTSFLSAQPRATFYIILGLIVTLVAMIGMSRTEKFAQLFSPRSQFTGSIDSSRLGKVEATDPMQESVTAVKEYAFQPADRLPAMQGRSLYNPLEDNIVRFGVTRRAGCWPIILANNGFKPDKIWKTSDGRAFRVELVVTDADKDFFNVQPDRAIHAGCDTLDHLAFKAGKTEDVRDMPRVFLQLAWSSGADGIVASEGVRTLPDLRDRRLLLSQTSPYFTMTMLIAAGVQPSEMRFSEWQGNGNSSRRAAADKQAVSGNVGIAATSPQLGKLAIAPGDHLLIDTTLANRVITDVCYARADFAHDNPTVLDTLARGAFEAMAKIGDAGQKTHCAKLMAEGYQISESAAMAMLGGVEATGWADNYQFLLNQNNPTNFERLWRQASLIYSHWPAADDRNGRFQAIPFDEAMDFSIVQRLGKDERYQSLSRDYIVPETPFFIGQIRVDASGLLTNVLTVYFSPNDSDPRKNISVQIDGKPAAKRYDPDAPNVLEGIGKLVDLFGASRIMIEGHADNSLRGQSLTDPSNKELALNRANAVRDTLLEKFAFEPSQVIAYGCGWDRPADPRNPFNYAKNRRAEIRIYPVEP